MRTDDGRVTQQVAPTRRASARQFGKAVAGHWAWLLTGIVLGALGLIDWLLDVNVQIPAEARWAIAALCVLVACFLAYHDLNCRLAASENELASRTAALRSARQTAANDPAQCLALVRRELHAVAERFPANYNAVESDASAIAAAFSQVLDRFLWKARADYHKNQLRVEMHNSGARRDPRNKYELTRGRVLGLARSLCESDMRIPNDAANLA